MTKTAARIGASIVAAAIVASGCGRGDFPSPETVSTPPISTTIDVPNQLSPLDPSTVDVSSPDAVAVAVVDTAYTMLPGVDESPNDALVRAAALLEQKLADAAHDFRPVTGAGTEWNSWASQHALVTASSIVGTQTRPPDGDTALRYLSVTQTAQTPNRLLARKALVLLVTMINTPDGWRVSRIDQL